MWQLKQKYNGYRVEQYNVIIDVLVGYSKDLEESVRKLLGARARGVVERMQKSVISNTLNIDRTFKINTCLGRLGDQILNFFSPEIQKHKCRKTCILLMFLRRF